MFRYLIAVSMVFSMSAYADGIPASKQQKCGQEAWIASFAATARDGGMSPQDAFKVAKNQHPNPLVLSEKYMKTVINGIYFDERLQGIPSSIVYNEVIQTCLNEDSQYKPLE